MYSKRCQTSNIIFCGNREQVSVVNYFRIESSILYKTLDAPLYSVYLHYTIYWRMLAFFVALSFAWWNFTLKVDASRREKDGSSEYLMVVAKYAKLNVYVCFFPVVESVAISKNNSKNLCSIACMHLRKKHFY